MAERSDLTTFWEESPRLIEVAAPSVEVVLQDLHDTLKSNTEQASEADDSLDNLDDDPLIDSAGKEDLGGGVEVSITSTLLNGQLAFESRLTPAETGTVTTANGAGVTLIDSAATFITNGVVRGAVVINFTDESITEVLSVDSETQLTTRVLRAGTDNDYDSADAYKVWNVIQCDITGGNLVAVDDIEDPISSVFPTAFTQIVRTASASATTANLEALEFSTYNGGITVDETSSNTGTVFPTGTLQAPVNNWVDARAIAIEKGFNTFFVIGDGNPDTGLDFTDFRFIGQGKTLTTLTLAPAATFVDCSFEEAVVGGTLDGNCRIVNCVVSSLSFITGIIEDCQLIGTTTLGGVATAQFINCSSAVPGTSTPILDMGGATGPDMTLRNYNGGIELQNCSDASRESSLDMNSGQVIIDSTISAGTFILRGIAKPIDNSTGTAVINVDDLIQPFLLTLSNKILRNKMITDPGTGVLTVFDDDGTTVLLTANIFEDAAGVTAYQGTGAERRERLT